MSFINTSPGTIRPADRLYELFKFYLTNDLDGVISFRQFLDRVVAGKYPALLEKHYANDSQALRDDMDFLENKVGWL